MMLTQTRRPRGIVAWFVLAASTLSYFFASSSAFSCLASRAQFSDLSHYRQATNIRQLPRVVRKASSEGSSTVLQALSIIIVGAGPSGLLLAHRLLQAGARVQLLEARGDPRSPEAFLEGRAYALGLGIRGRTAIRTSGEQLWNAITPSGFESDRFQLHLSPTMKIDLRSPEDNQGLEPSLLVYQSDLCAAILDQLEAQFGSSGRLQLQFGVRVESVDPISGIVNVAKGTGGVEAIGPADVVAGCDGVNSMVRSAIASKCNGFKVDQAPLPGSVKVIRFPTMPSKIDPAAVHAIPGAGGNTAFVEPTACGGCVLISWRDDQPAKPPAEGEKPRPSLGKLQDVSEAQTVLKEVFPLMEDVITEEAARQFVQQQPSSSSTVRCNTYHYGRAVLLGDAAHSTGGASGQGCNSALQDSAALADILIEKQGDVASSLLTYSKARVPEGCALLELSVGPSESAGPVRRALYGISTFLGTVLFRFRIGEPPLQTLLTTSLIPFQEVRRRRDLYFGDFPSTKQFDEEIERLSR